MKKILLVCTACFLAMQVSAQMDDAAMKRWQDYMTPGDMHKMMAAADGKWNGDITMWMTPGAPPSTSKGVMESKMIMGGRYQLSNSTGDFGGMAFEGMDLLGYDNTSKMFTATWVDNMGTGTMTMTGPYDPATKTITLRGKEFDPMSGKTKEMKETMKFIDATHQQMEMYEVQGKKEVKMMEIKYTKA